MQRAATKEIKSICDFNFLSLVFKIFSTNHPMSVQAEKKALGSRRQKTGRNVREVLFKMLFSCRSQFMHCLSRKRKKDHNWSGSQILIIADGIA